jgi:hypothetical protein
MRSDDRNPWNDDDIAADIDISQPEAPSDAGDLLAATPAVISFVIFGVTIAVDAILGVVSAFFAATIFLAFVTLLLLLVCGAMTILFCGIGAAISLIGALCSIRRPLALAANISSFLANATMVGLAWWLVVELMPKPH